MRSMEEVTLDIGDVEMGNILAMLSRTPSNRREIYMSRKKYTYVVREV